MSHDMFGQNGSIFISSPQIYQEDPNLQCFIMKYLVGNRIVHASMELYGQHPPRKAYSACTAVRLRIQSQWSENDFEHSVIPSGMSDIKDITDYFLPKPLFDRDIAP